MLNTFSNQTLFCPYLITKSQKWFYLFLYWLFKFNDTELDKQRFVQKIKYNYLTRFKFWLTLYLLLLLSRTPFNINNCILFNSNSTYCERAKLKLKFKCNFDINLTLFPVFSSGVLILMSVGHIIEHNRILQKQTHARKETRQINFNKVKFFIRELTNKLKKTWLINKF